MIKLINAILILTLFSNTAFGDCDFSTVISATQNHTYIYSEECHIKVGQMIQDLKTKDAQINDLSQAITLKDLALTKADSRTQLWQTTSDQLQDRMSKIDELKSKNNVLYFALGALTMLGAGYMASKLIQK